MFKNIVQQIKKNDIIKASLIVSLITCFVKIVGYIEKILLAYNWGTSNDADAYNAIFAFIMSIFIFFREIIEPGYLNNFLKVKYDHGEKESWRVFFSVLWCILPIGIIISLCIFLFPNTVTQIILPGFSGDQLGLASKLMKIASFSCVFLILTSLTHITLNAYKRFSIAIIGDLFFKLTIVVFIVVFASKVGIYVAAYGLLLGAILKLIIHLWGMRKDISVHNYQIKPAYLRSIWILTWPLLIGITFSQISILVDNIFASYLQEGSISALSYSKKIIELPVVIFPYALSIVIFPYFSEMYIEKNIERLRKLFSQTIKWVIIFFIPLAILIFFFSDTITQLIFQRGAFTLESSFFTSKPLSIYAIGLPAFALESVLVIFYFSIADTKTPIFTGIICVIINIIITWTLVQQFAYLGVAWGLVVSKTLKVIILLCLLKSNKFKIKNETTCNKVR